MFGRRCGADDSWKEGDKCLCTLHIFFVGGVTFVKVLVAQEQVEFVFAPLRPLCSAPNKSGVPVNTYRRHFSSVYSFGGRAVPR